MMQLLSSYRCFGGEQRFYQHDSNVIGLPMRFGVYLPAQALKGESLPALFFLAGLTCNEETFAIKAHGQALAAQLGLIIITPDTSPRGDEVAKGDSWDIGQGAGFYLDATQAPWAPHYRMASYLCDELYGVLQATFSINKIGVMGHSMGGHGALTLALRRPDLFASVSAIAPIAAPINSSWGQKAFKAYLGDDQTLWQAHDATQLMLSGVSKLKHILIDQGMNDQFLPQLSLDAFESACIKVKQSINLRWHEGYDHGYYFIQTVIDAHFHHHMAQLKT